MITALFIWTIVAAAGTPYTVHREYDWRPLGEFASVADCERAAATLILDPKKYRCVSTGKR